MKHFQAWLAAILSSVLVVLSSPAGARSVTLPRPVQSGIGSAQIFEYKPAGTIPFLTTKPDFVWGARVASPDQYRTYYVAFDRDAVREHDENWYKENRPDWLVYKCDRKNLALSYKYSFGYYMPIDISNIAVRQYFWSTKILPALKSGFQGIAFDNVSAVNYASRCGTYQAGSWDQQFTGARVDKSYSSAVRDWLSWMAERIHGEGGSVAINLFFSANDVEGYESIAAHADIIVDEGGFSRKCHPWIVGNAWKRKIETLYKIAQKKSLVIIDQTCPELVEINQKIVNWTLASALLVKGERTYLSITDYKTKVPGDAAPHSKDLNIGAPISEINISGGVYTRAFQNGIVLVNPTSRELEKDIGSDGFIDLFGSYQSGTIKLMPESGYILLKRNL